MNRYLYQTSHEINHLFTAMSIVSILIPMVFIFTKYAKDLYETEMELEFLANTDMLTQTSNRRSMYETGTQ